MGNIGEFRVLLVIALVLLSSSSISLFYRWAGLRPLTAREYVGLLGVGIDVDWLSFARVRHYYFYWRSRGVSVPLLFVERGFDSVRIRVSVDVTRDGAALRELAEVVNDCLRAGLVPVIAYTAPELRREPPSPGAVRHFIEWWVRVAEYFKGYPYLLSYDLIVETSGYLRDKPALVNMIYNETIAAIRGIDRYRIIIVTAPANASSPFSLRYLRLRWDPYMIAEWHIYAGGPCPGRAGRPSKPVYTEAYIEEAVGEALEWSRRTGVPVWVGAWRPNCYPRKAGTHSPREGLEGLFSVGQILPFTEYMTRTLCHSHIPFAVNSDIRLFNIEALEWYRSQEPVLATILSCRP